MSLMKKVKKSREISLAAKVFVERVNDKDSHYPIMKNYLENKYKK